ncbi:MAG: rRNA maturation RNase YbeY [Chloroflexi bacterium]|nr:rRNA maturation RNase YbeY [Chloroflexota bacterium]
MVNILIKRPFRTRINSVFLEKTADDCVRYLSPKNNNWYLSIVIGSDDLLTSLNKRYRGINKPTDVLSFDSQEIDPETGFLNIGDIVISFQTAERQSLEAKHPVINEIQLLLIHGVLHLFGYDHDTEKGKEIMWEKQKSILAHLGISINKITGEDDFD